ncbi:MAG: prepilin-type N-terminal cleavage/methylation domain-containing protein [Pseudomonadota bacterium]|nr:prepilin-type N-terminal cleavage/methylation domain-containing protein [Pseudomonadota bacterium]
MQGIRYKVAGENRATAGFTLIEMIIVIVILGIVGLIISHIINSATRGYQSRAAMKELQSSGRLALDYLELELRYAVPNSVRVFDENGDVPEDDEPGPTLEFGRMIFGGLYDDDTSSGNDMVVVDDLSGKDFTSKRTWLVVYNTGPADFYAGNNSYVITDIDPVDDKWRISCATDIDFSHHDPPRYYICDSAVKVTKNGDGLIYFSGYNPTSGAKNHGKFLCRKVESVSFVLQHSQAAEPTVFITLELKSGSLPLTLKRQVRLVNFH